VRAAFARPGRIMGLARFAPVRAARPPPRAPPRPAQGGCQQLFATLLPCHSWRASERARMHGPPCCWQAAAHWRCLAAGRRALRRARRGAAGGAAGAARGGRPDGAGLAARRQRARAARASPRCAVPPTHERRLLRLQALLGGQARTSAPRSSTRPPSRSLRRAGHPPARPTAACPAPRRRAALGLQAAPCCAAPRDRRSRPPTPAQHAAARVAVRPCCHSLACPEAASKRAAPARARSRGLGRRGRRRLPVGQQRRQPAGRGPGAGRRAAHEPRARQRRRGGDARQRRRRRCRRRGRRRRRRRRLQRGGARPRRAPLGCRRRGVGRAGIPLSLPCKWGLHSWRGRSALHLDSERVSPPHLRVAANALAK